MPRCAMWKTHVPITSPWGTYPVCMIVQKSWPDRSEVKGLPSALRCEVPSSAFTAVPTAMNSAASRPHS